MPTDPADLPFLLLSSFRTVVEQIHAELSTHGHDGAKPAHGFALQAIGPDGVRLGELARRLGTSKQAVTKTVASLEAQGYAERSPDPADSRAVIVRRTSRGREMLRISARAVRRAHRALAREVGEDDLAATMRTLHALGGDRSVAGVPAWLA